MSIAENVRQVQANIAAAARAAGREASAVTLVAATKLQSPAAVREAIAAGASVCGENRVQEMTDKLALGAYEGARLHFIGHLQTNKVKLVVGRANLIESVDSLRLLEAIEDRAGRLSLRQDILLEINIAAEASKGGIPPSQALELAQMCVQMPHIRLRGLMAIPPRQRFEGENRQFFAQMRQLYVDIRTALDDNVSDMDCLSMGMSADYQDAVREGATLVRLGTALFGPRPGAGTQSV